MHFGVAAAKQALADSGFELTDENRDRGRGHLRLRRRRPAADDRQLRSRSTSAARGRVAPTFIANALVDSCSGMIAIETGAIGHNVCMVSACATGTHNVGEAAEAIRRGDCIAVISGSTEAPLLEVGHAGFSNMRGMGMPRPGEAPQTVSRPFDLTRDGFVLGEGAGSLFLEDLELAKARGAQIYAEVVGYGSAADGWDMIQPIEARHRLGAGDEDGPRAARRAGRRGRPDQPARDLDAARRQARGGGDLDRVRRPRGARSARSLAISATKSMTGHMMGAAGAFEAFATVMSVAEQCAPPTINYRDPDPECDLWVVTETHVACRSATRSRTTSASAATTARSSSSATTATDVATAAIAAPVLTTIAASPILEEPPCLNETPRAVPSSPASARSCRSATTSRPTGRTCGPASPARGLIQSFDASAFEVRIAAEVLGFDPTTVMDAQDGPPDEPLHPPRDGAPARRPSRDSGHRLRGDDRGAARSGRRRRQHRRRRDRADHRRHRTSTTRRVRASSVPFAVPALSGSMAALHALDGVRPDRPGHHPGRRLRHLGHRVPRRPAPDPRPASATSSWPAAPRRRSVPMGVAALGEHDRALEAQRRARDRVAAVRRDARRLRPRRGRAASSSSSRWPTRSTRGATPIAEVIGGALTADAFHISAPEPTGRGQARAMTQALRNAGVAPDEIDYIVAHGTSTPLNDVTETRAIKAAYGDHAYKVAISSPKSMIGHLVGRRRDRQRAGRRSGRSATRSSRRRPTCTPRIPSATSTTCR